VRAAVLAAAIVVAGALPASAVGAGFIDPLDAPALATPLAARSLLTAVATAGDRLVAVGQRGHVVFSDDRGASWSQAAVPVRTDLTAVAFATPERGWAVGHGGVVLATSDGGRTWARQRPGAAPEESFLDVWFADERTGFAVGAFGLLCRTGDGGATWTRWDGRAENPRRLHLYAVRPAAGAIWLAGEAGLLLRLDGDTQRFRRLPLPHAGSFFGLSGDDDVVLAYGLRGGAVRSDDRGATFREVATGVDAAITGSTRLGDGRIVLVTLGGDLLLSDDAGRSFRRLGGGPPAAAVAAAGRDSVAIVGPAGARVERLGP
jgi:photosystem II stability/assembly factor-like uncharacterized protein